MLQMLSRQTVMDAGYCGSCHELTDGRWADLGVYESQPEYYWVSSCCYAEIYTDHSYGEVVRTPLIDD